MKEIKLIRGKAYRKVIDEKDLEVWEPVELIKSDYKPNGFFNIKKS